MNIDLVGYISESVDGETLTLEVDGHKVAAAPGGNRISFRSLHQQSSSIQEIFRKSVDPLLELFISGFNSSLVVIGESSSGKSRLIAGDSAGNNGLLHPIIENTFARLAKHLKPTQYQLQMQVFELFNESFTDLCQSYGTQSSHIKIEKLPDKGPNLKGLKSVSLPSSSEGTSKFRQAWLRRFQSQTDHGPSKNYTSSIIQFDLTLYKDETPLPQTSQFSIVRVSGVERLCDDSATLFMRHGSNLDQSLVSLSKLVASLANQSYPERIINYSGSKLVSLLQDTLGGNCMTKVIVCLKPNTSEKVFSTLQPLAVDFSKIKNFPVINDNFCQQLLTQYRARVYHLERQLDSVTGLKHGGLLPEVHSELRRVQTENIELRDKLERCQQKLADIQMTLGNVATSKTDLSAQLLLTEEEKLRISKTLIDMQISNNNVKEECEATKFELTNAIIQLESHVVELELERDKHVKANKSLREKVAALEQSRTLLAEQCDSLKTNLFTVKMAFEKEMMHSEQLGIELLNAVSSKAVLMRRLERLEHGHLSSESDAEVNRVKAMVAKLSAARLKAQEIQATNADRKDVERNLFEEESKFYNEIETLKKQSVEDEKKLENKIVKLYKDLKEARSNERSSQKRVSELNAQLIIARGQQKVLSSENNRLQHRLKNVFEDFRERLAKYVGDIANYVDRRAGVFPPGGQREKGEMKSYMDEMIRDLRRAHRLREEQLSSAALQYKNQTKDVSGKHEELLVAYRDLRQQAEGQGLSAADLGPDEWTLQLNDPELQTKQRREINRLRDELQQTQNELESIRLRTRMSVDKTSTSHDTSSDMKNWTSLRRELHEFTAKTQQEFEDERAELSSKNEVLQAEVRQLEDYIDTHLIRYKDEISRLREMLKMAPAKTGYEPVRKVRH